jgi:Mg2+/Co2+ transporter CorB
MVRRIDVQETEGGMTRLDAAGYINMALAIVASVILVRLCADVGPFALTASLAFVGLVFMVYVHAVRRY